MAPFAYVERGFEVREAIVEAHRQVWEAISRPGSFWTGAPRVAIAGQARAARAQCIRPHRLREKHDIGAVRCA